MIDEYDKNYFLLSCDICGITEKGPFETFNEAVQYKKDHPEEWKSIFMKDAQTGKYGWHDVCANKKCMAETPLGTWKTIPTSKRIKSSNSEPEVNEDLTNMANSIAKTISKRKREII
jgi:hypothetical protein